MFPAEACRDLQVRIFHRAGDQQCVLTLYLQCGDDAQSRVLQAFQRGQLPGCLYRPTLEYVTLAIRESVVDDDVHAQHSLDEPLWTALTGGIGQVKRAVLRMDPALEYSLCDLEERRWPRPLALCRGGVASDGAALTSSGNGCGIEREVTFWCAYDFLLRHRPAFFRTIGTLEESYLKGIRELQGNLRRAISQLQIKQSMEMEEIRQNMEMQDESSSEFNSGRSIRDVVAQHVGELDAVELHWRAEIQELKVKQKASYRDLIVDFFEQEIDQLTEHDHSSAKLGMEESPARRTGAAAAGESPSMDAEDTLSADALARPLGRLRPQQSLWAHGRAGVGAGQFGAGCGGSGGDGTPGEDQLQEALYLSGGSGGGGGGAAGSGQLKGDLKVCAEVRAVFGQRRIFFALRLFVGDVTDLLPDATPPEEEDGDGGVGDAAFAAAADWDGAGPQLPPEFVGLGSHGQYHFARGSGLPVEAVGWPLIWPDFAPASAAGGPMQHTFSTASRASAAPNEGRANPIFRSPSMRFWSLPCVSPPVELSPNAYADRLHALVIPTPENLKFELTQAVLLREFAARCNRVTDLHFPSLAEQLQSVQAATASTPLKGGDYFCTRHSNLGGVVQVAFHLLTGSSEASASDDVPASMHRALRRIVGDCHRCHIVELTLPLLLLDIGTSESSLPYAVAQRRSENVLRALKGAFARLAEELAPSELPSLQVVNLVLPASAAQSISNGIPSVADSVQTFLCNSFQCV